MLRDRGDQNAGRLSHIAKAAATLGNAVQEAGLSARHGGKKGWRESARPREPASDLELSKKKKKVNTGIGGKRGRSFQKRLNWKAKHLEEDEFSKCS